MSEIPESKSDAAKAKEAQDALMELQKEEKFREMMDGYVSRDEIKAMMKERDEEYAKMRTALLKAKNQGKAHIMEENTDPNAEIESIYGKNSFITKALKK